MNPAKQTVPESNSTVNLVPSRIKNAPDRKIHAAGGVYSFLHDDGRRYIGSSGNMMRRFVQHASDSKTGSHCTIHKAFRKYGFENFTFEVLMFSDSKEVRLRMEEFYISKFDTCGEKGFNSVDRPSNTSEGFICSELTRQRRRAVFFSSHKMQENLRIMSLANRGRKRSEESKKKVSDAKRGKKRPPFSKQWKENMSKVKMGKKIIFTDEWKRNMSISRLGKHPSIETRLKMSKSQTGRKHTIETRAKMSASGKERRAKLKMSQLSIMSNTSSISSTTPSQNPISTAS